MRQATGKTQHVRITKSTTERAMRSPGSILADTVETGLRLVVKERSASWTYAYRPRGKRADGSRVPQRTMTLGGPATMTPDQARARVREIKEAVRAGGDPAMGYRRPTQVRHTLGDLAQGYVPSGSHKHQRDEKAHLNKALDEMNARRLSPGELRVSNIRALIDLHSSRPSTARHRHGAVQRFLDELVEQEIIEVNVAKNIKRRPAPPPPRTSKPRAREVQALWNADLEGIRSKFVKAALLLPLRIGELAELTGDNIDHERQAIVLRHLETKNRDPFALPIPDQAMWLISEPALGKRLFQLNSRGGPMNSWSALLKRLRQSSGVETFGFHDIRRAFVSELAEHNIGSADLLDGLLNHRQSETKGSVKAHYHQAGLWPQKVAAMKAWGRLVEYAVNHGRWPREDGVDV